MTRASPPGRDDAGAGGSVQFDVSTQAVFDYFPRWESRFEYHGGEFGGRVNDYRSAEITILNHPALHGAIDLAGKTVLELGPLEGGNTMLLVTKGASHVMAVEGRVENYVKCCVIKNLYGLGSATFALDDVRNVTLERYGRFDVALVAGILYHLDNPAAVLGNVGRMVDTVVVATHVAGDTSPSADAPEVEIEMEGRKYSGRPYSEGSLTDPHSGLQPMSFWPYEPDLLEMIRDAGFDRIDILDRPRRERDPYELVYLVAGRL
jgi:hypothetical protein